MYKRQIMTIFNEMKCFHVYIQIITEKETAEIKRLKVKIKANNIHIFLKDIEINCICSTKICTWVMLQYCTESLSHDEKANTAEGVKEGEPEGKSIT